MQASKNNKPSNKSKMKKLAERKFVDDNAVHIYKSIVKMQGVVFLFATHDGMVAVKAEPIFKHIQRSLRTFYKSKNGSK